MVSARGGFSLAIVENRGETAAARTYRCQVFVRRAATLLCSLVRSTSAKTHPKAAAGHSRPISLRCARGLAARAHFAARVQTRVVLPTTALLRRSSGRIPARLVPKRDLLREGPASRLTTRASRPERSLGWLSRVGGRYLTSVRDSSIRPREAPASLDGVRHHP